MITIPPGVRVLTESLTINGWSYTLNHAEDCIDVEAHRGEGSIAVTWRAQEPGAYCEINSQEATFTKVIQAAAA